MGGICLEGFCSFSSVIRGWSLVSCFFFRYLIILTATNGCSMIQIF